MNRGADSGSALRRLVAAAIVAVVVVILAPMSSAAAQQQAVTITRVLNIAGPPVSDSSGIACQANISATFAGESVNGVISGTWSPWYATTSCNGPMVGIDVRATLVGPFNSGATPLEACGPCTPDEVVTANGPPLSCSDCNGEWTETGYFYYDFPYVPGAVLYGPNCTDEGLDQAECTVTGTTVLS